MFCPAAHTTPKKRAKNSVFYRFNFNGQERDDEVYGAGNSYTAEFWQYDSRLGRRWNVDPYFNNYPHFSPYSVLENNPIAFVDSYGDSTIYFMKGRIIHISHDNLENAITILEFKNHTQEMAFLKALELHKMNGTADSDDANRIGRKYGVSYMIDDYKLLFNYSLSKSGLAINDDGSTVINPLYKNEFGFINYIKNNMIRPGEAIENTMDWTTDYGVLDPSLGESASDGHTHPNAGKPKDIFSSYLHHPSGNDYNLIPSKYHETVITPKYLFLYKSSSDKGNVVVPLQNTFDKTLMNNYEKFKEDAYSY